LELSLRVHVKLFATLLRFSSGGYSGAPFDMEVPGGSTLADVVRLLNIPAEEVKVTFVNGIIQSSDQIIQPDDEIGIFPPIGGG
jgi:molybdopterin synthase sulfur carrier subunit